MEQVTHKTSLNQFKSSGDYYAYVIEVLRSDKDTAEIGRLCGITEMKARKWKHALLNGQNLKQRAITHYHRYVRFPQTGERYIKAWNTRQEREKWCRALLEDMGAGMDDYMLSSKYGISEKQARSWKELTKSGEDVSARMTTHYKTYIQYKKEENADSKIINGEKCAMCGVFFRKAHGHAVVCNDCVRRHDYPGHLYYKGHQVPLEQSIIPELEA